MPVYRWSQTAAANASADPGINYQENQAPSSLNDSARGAMAAIAQWRDDISGATVTTGTSAAYALSTFSNFTSAALLANQVVAFTPHVTNAAGPVTVTIDSVPNIPLRSAPNAELQAGVLIAGTPYLATYNNTDGALYLQGFYGNPYNIPLAAGMDYWASTAPNSAFAFPIGQPISRLTYSKLFALIGTTYGVGDGTTTFNLPDKTGRVSAMKEAAASRLTTGGGGVDGATMGSAGGAQTKTLALTNLPNFVPAGTVTVANGAITISATYGNTIVSGGGGGTEYGGGSFGHSNTTLTASQAASTATFTGTPLAGANSTPIATLPPLIVCNYIMRII